MSRLAATDPADAAAIEASLELAAERGGDLAPAVYARLFARAPQMQALFWRDTSGAIKGEMLAKVFEAILDFTGPRVYAHMLIETEGRNYTASEYSAWLTDAGFVEPRTVRFDAPGANGAVVARKP